MSGRYRILLLSFILIVMSLIIGGFSITLLYKTAIDEEKERLKELAQSQACLIEAIARFAATHTVKYHPDAGTPAEYTLQQIKDAHSNYVGFGNTGEFTLSRREGNEIVFLLDHRHSDLDNPQPIPFDSKLAEPMRLALSGKSGTAIGLDYRGVTVLAAYEPVSMLDFGIVAKIDLSEIRSPFLRAAGLSILVMLLIVFIGVWLLLKITDPMIKEQTKLRIQLSNAMEMARLGHWEYDVATDTFTFNDQFYKLFGTTAGEVGGYNMTSEEYGKRFLHPDDIQSMKEETRKAIETNDPNYNRRIGCRIFYSKGTLRYLSVQFSIIKDNQGNTIKTYGVNQDITDQKLMEEELKRLSFLDGLTGVANRRRFDEVIDLEWRRMTRNAKPLSLIMCDIDFFKAYNDTYGHQSGDDILIRVADTLNSVIERPGDLVARYGGEEYAVILPGTDSTGAKFIAEKMRVAVQSLQINHEDSRICDVLTVSLGVATTIPTRGAQVDELIAASDKALYEAKNEGRNRVNVERDAV